MSSNSRSTPSDIFSNQPGYIKLLVIVAFPIYEIIKVSWGLLYKIGKRFEGRNKVVSTEGDDEIVSNKECE